MNAELVLPAPLWRRLAAAVYDLMLLIALVMATLVLLLPVQALFGLQPGSPVFRPLLFIVGLAFFAGFWTRAGQTLGMRAWRLQVRRDDGAPLRLPVAAIRYAVTLAYWGLVLLPLGVGTMNWMAPAAMARFPHGPQLAVFASLAVVVVLALRGLDGRGRLPQDWLSGSEVVVLPPLR